MNKLVWLWLPLSLLTACDQMKERAGFPDPARLEADGKAIGGACRNSGRGLEDCYQLNPEASKAAVYAGWKEMNEYMAKNNLQAIVPEYPMEPPAAEPEPAPKAKAKAAHGEKDGEKTADKEGDKGSEKKAAGGKDAAH